jgi:hypothetical protein
VVEVGDTGGGLGVVVVEERGAFGYTVGKLKAEEDGGVA